MKHIFSSKSTFKVLILRTLLLYAYSSTFWHEIPLENHFLPFCTNNNLANLKGTVTIMIIPYNIKCTNLSFENIFYLDKYKKVHEFHFISNYIKRINYYIYCHVNGKLLALTL